MCMISPPTDCAPFNPVRTKFSCATTCVQRNPFILHPAISKMRYSLLFLLLFIGLPQSFGQLKQRLADGHFELMEYAKCVDMYDELAQKCISGSKKGDWNNVRKAAESHYHLFEMPE